MQFSPHQLKERLLRGLDEENNVVDMAAVLEVVSLLETCPITRDALEQTRIGRLVNELRKKTTNNDLAKRAKRLVRSWQKLISSHSESCSVNGDDTPHPPISKPCSPASSVSLGSNRSVTNASKSSLSTAKTTKSALSPTGEVSKSNNTPKQSNDKGTTRSSSYASKPASSDRNQVYSIASSKTGSGRPLTPSSRPLTPSGRPLTPSCRPLTPSGRPLTPSSRPLTPSERSRTPAISSLSSCSNKPLTPTGVSCRPSTPLAKPSTPVGRSSTPSSRPSTPSSRPVTPTIGQAKYQNNGISSASNASRSDSEKHNCDDAKGTFPSRDSNSCYKDKQSEQRVTRLSNHSPELPISKDVNSNSNNSRNALSKTNVANRKRTRLDNLGPQPAKKPTTSKDFKNVSLTFASDSINNGQMSTKSSLDDSLKNNLSGARPSWLDNVEPYPLDDKLSLFTKKGSTYAESLDAKDKSFLKTPKVKTTAQLIAELQAKSGSSSFGSNIMQKINKNQIDKESDNLNEPVVPFDALPRSRQKSLMNSLNDPPKQSGKRTSRLSKTKTELVEKFLESSVHGSEFSPMKLEASESPDIFDTSGSAHSANMSINTEKSREKVFTPIPKRKSPTAELDEIYRMLPPLNVDEIVWDEDDTECYKTPKPMDGTETNVDRVQSQQWNGVNGCFDTNNSWHDWTQTISYSSYEEDSLHVLPYVNIDS